jgi:acetyl-CoA carboxylase biotin carboxyl carrier protein
MAKKGKDGVEHDPEDIVATVRGLAEVVTDHNLSELVVEMGGATVTLRRGGVAQPMMQMAAPMPMQMHLPPAQTFAPAPAAGTPALAAPAAPIDDKAHVVTSPFVGTFYRKPNPDSPSYVSLNDKVEKGAVLCIVEAMKLMNEIEADISGTIVGILVEDGAPVEYGQALFKIAT